MTISNLRALTHEDLVAYARTQIVESAPSAPTTSSTSSKPSVYARYDGVPRAQITPYPKRRRAARPVSAPRTGTSAMTGTSDFRYQDFFEDTRTALATA